MNQIGNGMRIVYILKRDANVVLNTLYNILNLPSVLIYCIGKGRPQMLNLKDMIHYFGAPS
jgi:DNA gyrase subunit A